MLQMKKEIANIWEYKVGNNAIVANLVSLWKTRIGGQVEKKNTFCWFDPK